MTIVLADLTTAAVAGTGVFDVLMQANKAHLEAEFTKGRLKGPEYATVYLGALQAVMAASVEFLLAKEKANLEATLIAKQILLADKEIEKTTATIAQITAQTALVNAQKALADAEGLNAPKQGALIDAQKDKATQEKLLLIEQTESEAFRNFVHPTDATLSGTLEKERQVLVGQKCKLDGEFSVLQQQVTKVTEEKLLIVQKTATEKAQILALGVDDNSVVGKQKLLYAAQAAGFARDAEQKAAKIMTDTWNVRRTTDEATVWTDTGLTPNYLGDSSIGAVITKLKAGIGAV